MDPTLATLEFFAPQSNLANPPLEKFMEPDAPHVSKDWATFDPATSTAYLFAAAELHKVHEFHRYIETNSIPPGFQMPECYLMVRRLYNQHVPDYYALLSLPPFADPRHLAEAVQIHYNYSKRKNAASNKGNNQSDLECITELTKSLLLGAKIREVRIREGGFPYSRHNRGSVYRSGTNSNESFLDTQPGTPLQNPIVRPGKVSNFVIKTSSENAHRAVPSQGPAAPAESSAVETTIVSSTDQSRGPHSQVHTTIPEEQEPTKCSSTPVPEAPVFSDQDMEV
ncbi:hypothetical protein ACEPAI_8525 [Sanghuangporus weigelae]